MYSYLILALQGYCVCHCYVNRNEYYWIFGIVFLPGIGSLVYLFMNVVQKHNIDKVQQGAIAIINPSKKIIDLEKQLKFATSFENKVALADAYFESEHFEKAIEQYEGSLKGVFIADFYVISKLQEAHYFSSQFEKAMEYAERIKEHLKLKKLRASFLDALVLKKTGHIEEAETRLRTFDTPYARCQERLEFATFLFEMERPQGRETFFAKW